MRKIKKEIEIHGFNSIYFFEFGKNFSHSLESHNFWEMVYVDSGEILTLCDDEIIILKQEQAIFHKPNQMHSHISNKKTPNNMLVVSFTSDSSILDFFDGKIFTLNKQSKKILSLFTDECKNALINIPNDFNDRSPLFFDNASFGSMQLMECYFIEYLYSLIRNSEFYERKKINKVNDSRSEDLFSEEIIAYMKERICANFSLDDICRHFSISKSYLCQKFKESTGNTIIDCYIKLKIDEAKKLIRTEEFNITQIADMLGYSSVHHFSRSFKSVVGFSPLTYKKSIK